MFERVLIANRGAIAVRIIRTLKQMGIKAIAVYAEADRYSMHVRLADEAFSLGDGNVRETYLDQDKLLAIAATSGAEAVHPGYGFLSENAGFVTRCQLAGVVFLGPTVEQMAAFGLKHRARELAQQNAVPLLPGSGLLRDMDAACVAASEIGYPVMLKSTAGGGGIGMQRCDDRSQLIDAFTRVKRLAGNNFADDGVFLEKFIARARHIEVQVFGDGKGQVLALGERDCSAQRRNQKVIEETPAPGLSEAQRQQLQATAVRLCQAVSYRSAGTVEYVYDEQQQQFWFLEVNTRLQVEHGVTEMVYGVDIVRWMVQLGAGTLPDLASLPSRPQGHAIQVRLYAEDPARQFQPGAGLLSQVHFPQQVSRGTLRIDRWLDSGNEVSPFYDPMLAKLIVHADDRPAALASLAEALDNSQLYGIETNLRWLRHLLRLPEVQQGRVITATLGNISWSPATLEIISGGTLTTIQDASGRIGYWHVGVPPSGPFDSRSFRLANQLLGNHPDAAGLEITLHGPTLRFNRDCALVISGAQIDARLDQQPVKHNEIINARAGQTLALGDIRDAGCRSYLLLAGGIDCPQYLGSRSTFTLGKFGGHAGRQLRAGDVLHLAAPAVRPSAALPAALTPAMSHQWQLRVVYGPHGAPDFFTPEDIDSFFSAEWQVHYNSSRTGVRLIGPKPEWARSDGGEAGMHPSNIHDNAYAFGTIDFTGDMPVILGPDGPSLGGFVCPATVIAADLWQVGQLKAGDSLRFVPVTLAEADRLALLSEQEVATLSHQPQGALSATRSDPLLYTHDAAGALPSLTIRAAGDRFLLVEYGEQQLDIALRFRVHALMQWLEQHPVNGRLELTPGIRSLQIHFNSLICPREQLLAQICEADSALGSLQAATVPSRTVWLPLSWDDGACREAITRYTQSVRPDAPWCPSNIEFIRRINGLDSVEQVKEIVFSARYLVMGLGDVYLGAPVATPLDPRHRLVTTKYNPARTWTAENSVGIGGAYMCVYGMEGPGGYQFVGRTLQMWNRDRQTAAFHQPWLLRFFDQIRFYPVSAEALLEIRERFPWGDYPLRVEEGEFSLAGYQAELEQQQTAIDAFQQRRQQAFDQELARWRADGQFTFDSSLPNEMQQVETIPDNCCGVESQIAGSLWQWLVEPGSIINAGETVGILESMKMEIPITAPVSGKIRALQRTPGQQVQAGQLLLLIETSDS
ncbi:urea carboxylase [Erwinia toletana]|uniref:Urea carboxylase n=1 Tax=Winslowiella toletana TaxID=92490 RepID=A0ABS4P8E3_9GAMM|nr:urea carboxylase [Winslowiella toletana]MBP2168921.1 urea carboxylase [Winslowiella toletana]